MSDADTTSEGGATELGPGLDNLLFNVWLVSRATHALLDDGLRPAGLDADEFAVYSVLASADGMTPSELARWMAAPATTVSSYVKRFERRGHVERTPNPDDGRSYHLALTAAGRRAHRAAGRLFLPLLAEVTDLVGENGPEIRRGLHQLHRSLETLSARSRSTT